MCYNIAKSFIFNRINVLAVYQLYIEMFSHELQKFVFSWKKNI